MSESLLPCPTCSSHSVVKNGSSLIVAGQYSKQYSPRSLNFHLPEQPVSE